MRNEDALEKIIKSKKYAGVCEATVIRVLAEAAERYAPNEVEKAARAKLHQITGAFMTPDEVKRARKCLDEYKAGDEAALNRALQTHASTRERASARELFDRVFSIAPRNGVVLDMACGLNPLVLGDMGLNAWGCDISRDAVEIINDWSRACGWNVRAETRDLLNCEIPKGDTALFMKLLPVIERQKRGEAERLFKRTEARWKLVTFPTKTLSGRSVGMEKHYSDWFEGMLGDISVLDRFTLDGEVCYLLEDKNV